MFTYKMETNCSSNGGDDGGDDQQLKILVPKNCAAVTTASTAQIPTSILIKMCKLTSPVIGGVWNKKNEETCHKRDLEDKEENKEVGRESRVSSRVKRSLAKISPQIPPAPKIRKVENQGTTEENSVESKVQVKLEEFPQEYEEDMEVDSYWFNENNVDMESPHGHRDANCLLCYKAMSPEEIKLKPVLTNDLVEANLNNYFILRKMLHVPKSKLATYLVNFGDPQNWIQFCRQCLSGVDKALRIQKQIEMLEYSLRKLQNGMVDKIKSTFEDGHQTKILQTGSVSIVTEDTRQFIFSKFAKQVSPEPPVMLEASSLSSSSPPPLPFHLQIAPEEDDMDAKRGDTNDLDFHDDNEEISPASPSQTLLLPSFQITPNLSKKPKYRVAPFKEEVSVKKMIPNFTEDPQDQSNYLCSLCPSLGSMSVEKFYSHGIFHYKRQFKCSECNLHWSGPTELEKNPLNIPNKSGGMNKHVCSKETLEKMPEFLLGRIWKCAWCRETFNLDKERDSHEAQCSSSRKYEADKVIEMKYNCLSCPDKKRYRSHEEWLLHRVLEHPKICLQSCLYCGESCGMETNAGIDVLDILALKNHLVSEHPTKPSSFWETCDFCGLACHGNLGSHLVKCHVLSFEDARHCPICHLRTKTHENLRHHVKIIHNVTQKPKQENPGRIKFAGLSTQNLKDRDIAVQLQKGNYLCSLCPSSKPMSLVKFYGHLIFHYKRPFKCSECNLYWSSLSELEKSPLKGEHICSNETLMKMPEFQAGKIWKCAKCPESFSKETDRDFHEDSECPNKCTVKSLEYKCLSCSDDKMTKSYRNYEEWLLHRVLEHTETAAITSCLFCNESCAVKTKDGIDFFDIPAMKIHVSTEHPICCRTGVYPTDICELCGVTFQNNMELRRHISKLHGMKDSNAISCRICCYKTNKFPNLKNHVLKKHALALCSDKVEGEICDVCGVKMGKAGAFLLADHKLVKHGIDYPEDEEFQKRIKICEVERCGYRTLDLRRFKKHMMKMHGAERSHKCEICGKGFLDSGKLAEHLKIHRNKETKPYQCEICGNSFALRNYLYIHMRLSHLNRPFASTNKKRHSKEPAVRRTKEKGALNSLEGPVEAP